MIYDCFTFWNEFDLLEIRLNELKDVVDEFIICESNVTHVGNPKPLSLTERISDYKDFNIKVLVFEGSRNPKSSWENEMAQRNFLVSGLTNCLPDDVVIISDADEIPNPDALSVLPYMEGVICLEMTLAYYYANNLHKGHIWRHAKAVKFKSIERQFTKIRLGPINGCLKTAGHHMSYLGGSESVKHKVRNFAHQELNNNKILSQVDNSFLGNHLFSDSKIKLTPTDPSEIHAFPKYLLNNRDKFKHLFL